MQNMGVRWPGRQLGDDRVAVRFQVGDAVALDVAHGGMGGEVVQGAVGHDEAVAGEGGGRLALGASHLRVQRNHEQTRVIGGARGGADARVQVDRGHLLVASFGQHGPAFDAHRVDRRPPGCPIPDRGPDRERADQARRGSRHRVIQREPGVDTTHSVDERHPVDAIVCALERFPVIALHGGIDRAFGGGEGFILIEGCAVVRVPALDEDLRHGAHRTRGLGQPREVRRASPTR